MNFGDMVVELKNTTTNKHDILRRYMAECPESDFIRFLLREAYDPNILHNVLIGKNDIPPSGETRMTEVEEDIRKLFLELRESKSSAGNKRMIWIVLKGLTQEDQSALVGVINKNLRCGVSIKTLNKVQPHFISVIPIQLANKYNPDKKYLPSVWFASPKLDGVRVFAYRESEEWHLYSRNKDFRGKEIHTLDHWKSDLEEQYQNSNLTFLDGEAYQHGMKFEKIQSLVGSKVNIKDTTELVYNVFAMGHFSPHDYSVTVINPEKIVHILDGYSSITGVPQTKVKNDRHDIYECLYDAVNSQYEGIILRSTIARYELKRSDALLKVKSSDVPGYSGTEMEYDCRVIGIEYGDFVVREGGVESIEYLPVALEVEFMDGPSETMKVGSGMSLKDRRLWAEDESRILNKVIEVICQGLGAKGRMRFPRIKRVREDL